MNSGVYKLTFSSGRRYIGKSVDIPTRYQQHCESFYKGTAAKAMQKEYDNYGLPTYDVLTLCHPDHIDIVEACLISRLCPELNTTRVPDPFWDVEDVWGLFQLLDVSTLEHLRKFYEYDKLIGEWEELLARASRESRAQERQIQYLETERSLEEIYVDKEKRIRSLTNALDDSKKEIEYLQALNKLPWWKKIFK